MQAFELGVAFSAYCWFGWEYSDGIIKESELPQMQEPWTKLITRIIVTFFWPVLVITQVASHLARW